MRRRKAAGRAIPIVNCGEGRGDHPNTPQENAVPHSFASGHVFETLALFSRMLIQTLASGGSEAYMTGS